MKFFLSVLLSLCFAASAFAMRFDTPVGDIDAYASIRTYAMFQDISDSDSYRDLSEVKMGLQSNSRIGFKWNTGDLGAHYELGLSSTAISLRLLYGTYKINGGQYGIFRAGQFTSISDTQSLHNRVFDTNAGLTGFGAVSTARRAGFGYQYKGFAVQLTTLTQDMSNFTNLIPKNTYDDIRYRELAPKVELEYAFESIPLRIFGAYAYFTADAVDNVTGKKEDFDAHAYHAGLALEPRVNDFTFKLSGFYSTNGGPIAWLKVVMEKGCV